MVSDKPIVGLLSRFLEEISVEHIVISPGSRNAPLIITLTTNTSFTCYSIIDERCAGYYALGMARQTGKPVAVVCTSGTAVLNLSPALAEAYYQEVPVIAITADRPAEWIDHEDGQTIRQENIFANYIRHSVNLPDESSSDVYNAAVELFKRAKTQMVQVPYGPVHINVPLSEPLYQTIRETEAKSSLIFGDPEKPANLTDFSNLVNLWNHSNKILLVAGVNQYNSELNNAISRLIEHLNIPVIAPQTANIRHESVVFSPDGILTAASTQHLEQLAPDLLITIGGSVVSKKLKEFIRLNKPQYHIDIDENPLMVDTYRCLSHKITANPVDVLNYMLSQCGKIPIDYLNYWKSANNSFKNKREEFFRSADWSDLWIFNRLMHYLIKNADVHLANSTPVRFAEYFSIPDEVAFFCNRGTSGIDGSISTAAGAALVSSKQTFIITGDIGFFYDSNALMNTQLPANLKIIVINNGGGGIFNILPGPRTTDALNYFTTPHQFNIKNICNAFNVTHFNASSCASFNQIWNDFALYNGCAVLELDTKQVDNSAVYTSFIKCLKPNK